jgi:predicted CXXCH cytochrome family protein
MKFKFFGKKDGTSAEHGKMLSRYIRVVTILIIILIIAGVGLAVANVQISTLAQVPTPTTLSPTTLPTVATADNCASCHEDVHAMWHKGGHGDARGADALAQQENCLACHKDIPETSMPDATKANQSFTDFWADQGKPTNCLECHVTGYDPATGTWKTDGITCESCHSPIPSNHPTDNIPVDKNTDLCRTCHTDARFGWDAWNESAHSKNDITCSNCHNPHSTALKPVDESATDASSLCENCHKDMAQNTSHLKHVETGATCIMCHVGPSKGDDDFHQVPDHDFKAKLDACNSCHADQMHGEGKPVSLVVEQDVPKVNTNASSKPESVVSATPARVKPFGYIGVAAVFGLMTGFVWRKIAKRRSRQK